METLSNSNMHGSLTWRTAHQTTSTLMTFFIAMLLYPDIQKKARDELDSVIGRERLPNFEDRPRLPFIDAVCKETLRWRPVTPLGALPQYSFHAIAYTTSSFLGVPHAVTKDDVYAGYFIPKGGPCCLN
jgi:hypothetical protein